MTGYSPECLSQLSCAVSNSAGIWTNQQIDILDRSYDTNTYEFTTNTFQIFDVGLTNGTNLITIYATDLAGNMTVTNFNFTVITDTVPPLVRIVWPQNGMKVCGSSLTIFGTTDDPSANFRASLTDARGNTNQYSALMERDGKFWFEDIPITNGVTSVSVQAVDSWGNTTTTNFSISQDGFGLTVDAVDTNQLFNTNVNVTGTVSDPTYAIWVNGIKGTNNGDGTWTAANVPIALRDTARIYVAAYPAADLISTNASSGVNPTDTNAYNASENEDSPPQAYISEYTQSSGGSEETSESYLSWGGWYQMVQTGDAALKWTYDNGGSGNWKSEQIISASYLSQIYDSTCSTYQTWPSALDTTSSPAGTITSTPDGCNEDPPSPPPVAPRHMDIEQNIAWTMVYNNSSQGPTMQVGKIYGPNKADAKVRLWTGGKAGISQKTIWMGTATATGSRVSGTVGPENLPASTNFAVPPTSITLGDFGQLYSDSIVYKALANHTEVDITPKVSGVNNYTFSYGATPYPLIHQVACQARTDTNMARLNLGVGEIVYFNWYSPMPNETQWTTSGGTLSPIPSIGPSVTLTAPSSGGSATVTATVRGASASVNFDVNEPSGVQATIANTFHYGQGTPGSGMQLNVVLQPTSVSFNQVQVYEIGEDASDVSGYFTTHAPLSHIGNGANMWQQVGCDNTVLNFDFCTLYGTGVLPPPWSAGGFTWQIPAVWSIGGTGPTNSLPWSDQNFSIDSSGTVTITKFGQSVTRTINDFISSQ